MNNDKLFNDDYFDMMNPDDRARVFDLYMAGMRQPTRSQLNNPALLSTMASNLLRNSYPELYQQLLYEQNQMMR